MSYQATARRKLGLSPLEETALITTSKSTTPVGYSRDADAQAIEENELIGKLLKRG